MGLGITQTNNKIKDIMKVIKSLKNRGILLKGITRKVNSQVGGFLNFLMSLMTAGLLLMKCVQTPLAKSVLRNVSSRCSYSKENLSIRNCSITNEEMEDIMEIVKSFEESGLLVKGISETIKNETKQTKRRTSSSAIRNISC